MQEYVRQVETQQTNRDMGVEQRLETGNSFAQGSVSDQDLTRFRDALARDGERSALNKLAATFCNKKSATAGLVTEGAEDPFSIAEGIGRKKTSEKSAWDDKDDVGVNAISESGIPLVETNAAQINPIIFPLPVREVRQLAQKIVDVLLVHEAALNEKQEITVSLKDCLLDGADVSIFRDGGVLQVSFSSLTSEMATIVKLNQGTLCEAIMSKTDIKEVKITTSQQLREDGDTNHGRSKGGFGNGNNEDDDDEETDSRGRRVRRYGRVGRKSTAGHA
ncbi:MAG: hypothetical protein LBF26_03610 [Puniceicoccales bacterium]|jgi:hypothetical protein|nr:hypothetical protein [Puniceicoccales bacterium]